MLFIQISERHSERERASCASERRDKRKDLLSAADNNCTEGSVAKTKDAEIIQQAVTPAARTTASRTCGTYIYIF